MNLKRWQNITRLGVEALSKYPRPEITKINLTLTMRCQHRCISCNIWQQQKPVMPELTVMDVKHILDINDNLMWVSLTGGEPSLAKHFEEILIGCMAKVRLVNIITNGFATSRIVSAVKEALEDTHDSILVIHLSLFGEETKHNLMTGTNGSYRHVIETIEGLKTLGYPDRLIIGFEHMISQYNPYEYKFVQHKANRMGVGVTYTFEQEAGYYANVNGGISRISTPKINLTLNPVDLFKNFFILNATHKVGCVAGEYSAWVMPDLTVYPCFFAIPDEPSYQLKENGYRLRRGYFKKDREWIDNCAGCATPCETYPMLIFRPWRLLKFQSHKKEDE